MSQPMTAHTPLLPAPAPAANPSGGGLIDEEAARRLREVGPNAVAEQH